MKISKTKLQKKIQRKRNPELRSLVISLKKQNQIEIASLLSIPKRKRICINLGKLDKQSKEGESILVPGKILGSGDLTHKIILSAFSISESAKNKLKGCKIIPIEEMIKTKSFKVVK